VIFYHGHGVDPDARLSRKYFEKAESTGFNDTGLFQSYKELLKIEDIAIIQIRNDREKLNTIGLGLKISTRHTEEIEYKPPDSISDLLIQYPDSGESLSSILCTLIEDNILSKDFYAFLDSVEELFQRVVCHELTRDEIASIYFYTCDLKKLPSQNLYFIVNSALRENKKFLLPYIMPYVHILIRAVSKLPTVSAQLYRGISDVELNPSSFIEKQEVIWSQFNSCSPASSVAKEFLAKKRKNTILFEIETKYGHDISKFSAFATEGEIIILPGAKFIVDKFIYDSYLCVVYLTQKEDLFV